MIQQVHFVYLSEENENTDLKRYMHLHATLALPTIAKIWEQPKCPLMNEWIKTLWYICVMKYYLAIKKKNEILPSATTWLNLDGIMPCETVSTIWSLFYVESKKKVKQTKIKLIIQRIDWQLAEVGVGA